jgi:sigma-E factor negative regulatory protein RseB
MKLVGRFFIVICVFLLSSAWADEQSLALLKRMNQAANSLDFDGVFLHVNGNKVETLRVIHKMQDDKVLERLYSLNGSPREVIRDAEKVWCFMPERKMGHVGLRADKNTGFPGFMASNLDELTENYILSSGGFERVADRNAVHLEILPRDVYRYGYEMWADKETGLLLKSVLIDEQKNVIEQYMFAFVNIGANIPDSDLQPMTSKAELEWHNDKEPPEMMPLEDSAWKFNSLPDGYQLINVLQRVMPMGDQRLEHMILSDGLAGVSVFIEKTGDLSAQISMEKMGAVNAYVKSVEGSLVTVVGEVPAAAVKVIGEALTQKH